MIANINNFGVVNFYENTAPNAKKEQAQPANVEEITPANETAPKKEQAYATPIPKENDYNEVRLYIQERKKYDPEFCAYWQNHTLKQNCLYLSKIFGWVVDEHSLGANLNRHR